MATMKLFLVGDLTSHGKFTQIPNSILRSSTLSRAAVGTLCYLLSHENNFCASFSVAAMAREFKDGRAAINRSLKELEDAGYIKTVNGMWIDGQTRLVRLVAADPSVLENYTQTGEIQFDAKTVLYYDIQTNAFRRGSGKHASNGKPVNGIATKPDNDPIEKTPLLEKLICMWNLLKKQGLALHGIDPDNPSNSLLKAFKKFSTHKKFADCREAFKDLDAVYKRLVAATRIHNEPYFRLDWLLTVAPNNGEFAAVKLMEGFYDGGTKAGTNGRSQGERGAGHGDAVRSSPARTRTPGAYDDIKSKTV